MNLSFYDLKRTALLPRAMYMRRKLRAADPMSRELLELHRYSRHVLAFCGASASRDLLTLVDIDADSLVLDVGAFRGEWSERIWDRYEPTIHAFEPAPGPSRRMGTTFADNDKVHVHQFGLGGWDMDASLALNGPGASIYGPPSKQFGSAAVRIRDVSAVLEELGVDDIDLLKINIEGGEYDLIDRLDGTQWLPRVRLLMVQFHEWHPRAHFRRRTNRRALRRDHDEVWGYPWCWELWRRRSDG